MNVFSPKKIKSVIKPIGFEILKWIMYHNGNNGFMVTVPSEFCWTPQGTIDMRKTAVFLTNDENIDITMRYRLACVLCLEEKIKELWKRVPENCKMLLYNEENPNNVPEHYLIIFWTWIVKRNLTNLNAVVNYRYFPGASPYSYALKISAIEGNSVATNFFYNKLSIQEIDFLPSIANSVAAVINDNDLVDNMNLDFHDEILFFLFLKMNQNQQKEVLRINAYQVLGIFLDWPLQEFFIEMSKHCWTFLTRERYGQLLFKITKKALDGFSDFDYSGLFFMYFQSAPKAYNEYVVKDPSINVLILANLCKIGCQPNINLFLQNY